MSHLCINIPTYKSWEGTGAGLQMVQLTQDLYVHDTEVRAASTGLHKEVHITHLHWVQNHFINSCCRFRLKNNKADTSSNQQRKSFEHHQN